MKRKDRYNDGIAKFYKKKTNGMSFKETKNVKSLDDLEYLGFLYFEEKDIRQQDIEFAEQKGSQITLKIATQDNGYMDTNMNVVIGSIIYAIVNIDKDRKKRELFFYLEEIRKI